MALVGSRASCWAMTKSFPSAASDCGTPFGSDLNGVNRVPSGCLCEGTGTSDMARHVRRQRLAWRGSEAWLVGPRESPGGCGARGILETLGVSENYSNRAIMYWA
ncbi:hypothetical protein ES288_D05G327400v1 [Gossypium darwinii]|uniref:Uncharacterized protein n=1 Tax=Gossypium darwinii TaxID=34276 RepID=A0A5D2CRD6_GOSDA|nr:hypothetical protein ES288_D05G327400v1 [Gossypium darwinii]